MYLMALLTLLLSTPTHGPPQAAVCVIKDNNNSGLMVQNCVPGLRPLTLAQKSDEPVEQRDGTFVRSYRYVAVRAVTFEMRVCSPYLIDFDLSAKTGNSLTIGMPSGVADCFVKQFSVEPGEISLAVRTTRREFTVRVEVAIQPAQSVGAPYLAVAIPIPPPPPPPPVPPPGPPPPPP